MKMKLTHLLKSLTSLGRNLFLPLLSGPYVVFLGPKEGFGLRSLFTFYS